MQEYSLWVDAKHHAELVSSWPPVSIGECYFVLLPANTETQGTERTEGFNLVLFGALFLVFQMMQHQL